MYLTKNNRIFRCLFIFLCGFFGSEAQTTLLVGSAETYTTIAGAYAACTNGATNYIIEIRTTYTNTESKPIALGANTAASVIIRPQSGVASLTLSTATQASVFNFTAGDNVTIDGRAGGSGSGVLTVENTQNAASKYAIQYSGGSTGNTIKYCTIKGSNTDATASSTAAGVIMFASGTNSSNTIDNCTIQQSGSNYPAVCINSYDATNNNQISVTNCNIANFTYYGLWANGPNNDNWTITGNSFYADYAQSGWTNSVYMLFISDGTGYTITGNYFGGRAAQCAGASAYTLSSTRQMFAINVDDSDAGTITISGNYIQNIAFTCTYTATQWAPMWIEGAADFTIGSSGNGNTIGATTGTGNIVCTDNSVASTTTYQNLIGVIYATGTVSMQYNTIGAITFNGSNASTKTIYFCDFANGTITFSNNTVGNTTSNNIILNGTSSNTYAFNIPSSCAGTSTCSSNTFRNIQNNATSGEFMLIDAYNLFTCSGNTLSGISSSSSSTTQRLIRFIGTENVSITSNTIKAITFSSSSSSVELIHVDAGTGAATANVSSNTLGEFGTTNDITLAGNDDNLGIYFYDAGAITVSGNVLQNFNISSTGTANNFYGIYTASSCDATNTYTDNVVDNISSASTENSGTSALTAFYLSGDGTNTIDHNTFTDLEMSSTGASTLGYVQGIYLNFPDGTVTVSKNRISGLTHKTTVGNSSQRITGIRSNTDGTNNFYNNVILLNNGSNTNVIDIWGFHSNSVTSGIYNLYHNTIKIYGTTAAGAASAPIYVNSTSGTFTLKNNLFQNLRASGSAAYGIDNGVAGTSFTENYNYVEAATFGYWQGSTYNTMATWRTNTGQGANDKNSAITVAASGVVASPTSSDIQNNGMDYDATVPTDIDGNTRHATTPYMGAYEGSTALPIELLHFTAIPAGKVVELSWSTATEINNDYFTIERSADGLLFEKMSIVQGAGNSNSTLFYNDTDALPLKGISYYRLKQTDFDGQYSYSQIVPVSFSGVGELTLFPNPAEHSVLISFFSTSGDTFTLQFFDAKGSIVKCQSYTADEDGINSLIVHLNEFEAGIYFVYLINRNEILKTKVVKQ